MMWIRTKCWRLAELRLFPSFSSPRSDLCSLGSLRGVSNELPSYVSSPSLLRSSHSPAPLSRSLSPSTAPSPLVDSTPNQSCPHPLQILPPPTFQLRFLPPHGPPSLPLRSPLNSPPPSRLPTLSSLPSFPFQNLNVLSRVSSNPSH